MPAPTSALTTPGGSCACIDNFAPVCANGTQYENVCRAKCDNVTDFEQGPCPAPRSTPANGRDSVTASR